MTSFWIVLFSALHLSGATTLSLPVRILACPGTTAQHSCTSSTSMNWNFFCPGQLMTRNPQFSRSVDGSMNTSFLGHVECQNGDSQIALLNIALTYESLGGDLGVSNISISVMVTNYSIYGMRSLTLDCNDDAQNYRYVDLIGLPPTPVNVTHQFEQSCNETHVPTTLSWLLPPEDEVEGGVDSPTIQYFISIMDEDDENMTEILLNTTNTNISVLLHYNTSYDVILRASRCDSTLSTMTSIEIDMPSYQTPSYPGLIVTSFSPGVLSYQCREGLVPEGTVISVCGRDGTWIPPPNQHNCTTPDFKTTTLATEPRQEGSTSTSTGDESDDPTVLILAGGVAGVVLLLLISVAAGPAIILIRFKINLNTTDSYPELTHTYEGHTHPEDPTHLQDPTPHAPQTNIEALYAEVQSPHNGTALNNHADRPSNGAPPLPLIPDTGEYSVLRGHWPVPGHTFQTQQPHSHIHTETPPSTDLTTMTSPYAVPVELDHTPHSQARDAGKQNGHATSVNIYNDAEDGDNGTITMDTTQLGTTQQREVSPINAEMARQTYAEATPTREGEISPTKEHTHFEAPPTGVQTHATSSLANTPQEYSSIQASPTTEETA